MTRSASLLERREPLMEGLWNVDLFENIGRLSTEFSLTV